RHGCDSVSARLRRDARRHKTWRAAASRKGAKVELLLSVRRSGTLTFLCLGAANAMLAVHTGVTYLPPSGHILMFTGVSLVDVQHSGHGGSTWHFAKRLTAWNTTSQRRRKWRRKSANSCAATS